MTTIYVDAAASALKPSSVISAELDFIQNHYANAGRGMCENAQFADTAIADTRAVIAEFIGAKYSENIVFTNGTTDGLNRIVQIIKNSDVLNSNSVVLVSDLDHHSARLPWEYSARNNNCKIALCSLDNKNNIDVEKITRSDIFVITAMSNVLGVPQDVKQIIARARELNPGVITIVDAAQYVAHQPINVSEWDCDFLCFSGHKIGANTGVGVMYIKQPERWTPGAFGGGMVMAVGPSAHGEWTYANGALKFESGTLPLVQIVGLKQAIVNKTDEIKSDNVHKMTSYLRDELSKIPEIKFISDPDASVLTFTVNNMHVLDFGAMAGAGGVCLRVGNMCASWLHRHLGLDASIRISVGHWNTMAEMKELSAIIKKIIATVG